MNNKPIQAKHLITVQRPYLWVLSSIGLVLVVCLAVWLSYETGRRTAGYDSSNVAQMVDAMQEQISALEGELAESRRQTAMLERNSQIDGDTSAQLKKTLKEAQSETLELKKELAFYKSIVAPEQGKPSIVIQTIQLKPEQPTGHYDYKIMVSQQGKNNNFARGVIEVSVEGKKLGKKQVLALTSISDEAKKPMKFGFKYFQNFKGTLKLPEGFVAEAMRVKLNPKSKTLEPVDVRFPWADLTAGD